MIPLHLGHPFGETLLSTSFSGGLDSLGLLWGFGFSGPRYGSNPS